MQLAGFISPVPRAQRLVTLEVPAQEGDVDFWIWLRALQGLINRQEPHLYLIRGDAPGSSRKPFGEYERHWLDYYLERFRLPRESLTNTDALLDRYRHLVDGYVLYDCEDVIQTQNLAITRAGLESLLPIAPSEESWMQRHGIPKRDDLRGGFSGNTQAAAWAVDNLWPHTSRRLFANFCVHRPFWYATGHTIQDFIVCHKGFALDLPLSRQTRMTQKLYRRMLESADPPGAQMGWHCICDQEKEYVAEAAERGFFTLCSVATPNLTVHSAVGDPAAAYTQSPPPPDACRADPRKVYACFYVSDGDATWAMHNLHSGNWHDPNRGRFELGWGLLPLMTLLMPGVLRYYHETRRDKDCFWGPSSGAAYTYTHLWPAELARLYLDETRRLLDQTGQHGCNMVNWFLRDWWREVEDGPAVRREQEALQSGPGLVCGLGGSPYAKSYLDGPIPKLHSMHIANVGQDTLGDIMRFAEECPTRPAFLFLFAQIAEGVLGHLAEQMKTIEAHPEIHVLGMDAFFLTLQDALARGLLDTDTLYEKTPALAERWLKAPGRHRLPLCERLTLELSRIAHADPDERRRVLAEAAWIDLVSREIEHVAHDREAFLTCYRGRPPIAPADEADTLLYVAFTVAWTTLRAAIEALGIYANHRTQCLEDFKRTCGSVVDTTPFERLFAAWEDWESGPLALDESADCCDGLARAAAALRAHLGPDESEEFTGWPPRTI